MKDTLDLKSLPYGFLTWTFEDFAFTTHYELKKAISYSFKMHNGDTNKDNEKTNKLKYWNT